MTTQFAGLRPLNQRASIVGRLGYRYHTVRVSMRQRELAAARVDHRADALKSKQPPYHHDQRQTRNRHQRENTVISVRHGIVHLKGTGRCDWIFKLRHFISFCVHRVKKSRWPDPYRLSQKGQYPGHHLSNWKDFSITKQAAQLINDRAKEKPPGGGLSNSMTTRPHRFQRQSRQNDE